MCVIVMFCYISAVSVLVLAVKGMFCVCYSHVLIYFSCISASSISEGHVLCVSVRGLTYKDSGVDIAAGNRLVDLIKPLAKATARPGPSSLMRLI